MPERYKKCFVERNDGTDVVFKALIDAFEGTKLKKDEWEGLLFAYKDLELLEHTGDGKEAVKRANRFLQPLTGFVGGWGRFRESFSSSTHGGYIYSLLPMEARVDHRARLLLNDYCVDLCNQLQSTGLTPKEIYPESQGQYFITAPEALVFHILVRISAKSLEVDGGEKRKELHNLQKNFIDRLKPSLRVERWFRTAVMSDLGNYLTDRQATWNKSINAMIQTVDKMNVHNEATDDSLTLIDDFQQLERAYVCMVYFRAVQDDAALRHPFSQSRLLDPIKNVEIEFKRLIATKMAQARAIERQSTGGELVTADHPTEGTLVVGDQTALQMSDRYRAMYSSADPLELLVNMFKISTEFSKASRAGQFGEAAARAASEEQNSILQQALVNCGCHAQDAETLMLILPFLEKTQALKNILSLTKTFIAAASWIGVGSGVIRFQELAEAVRSHIEQAEEKLKRIVTSRVSDTRYEPMKFHTFSDLSDLETRATDCFSKLTMLADKGLLKLLASQFAEDMTGLIMNCQHAGLGSIVDKDKFLQFAGQQAQLTGMAPQQPSQRTITAAAAQAPGNAMLLTAAPHQAMLSMSSGGSSGLISEHWSEISSKFFGAMYQTRYNPPAQGSCELNSNLTHALQQRLVRQSLRDLIRFSNTVLPAANTPAPSTTTPDQQAQASAFEQFKALFAQMPSQAGAAYRVGSHYYRLKDMQEVLSIPVYELEKALNAAQAYAYRGQQTTANQQHSNLHIAWDKAALDHLIEHAHSDICEELGSSKGRNGAQDPGGNSVQLLGDHYLPRRAIATSASATNDRFIGAVKDVVINQVWGYYTTRETFSDAHQDMVKREVETVLAKKLCAALKPNSGGMERDNLHAKIAVTLIGAYKMQAMPSAATDEHFMQMPNQEAYQQLLRLFTSSTTTDVKTELEHNRTPSDSQIAAALNRFNYRELLKLYDLMLKVLPESTGQDNDKVKFQSALNRAILAQAGGEGDIFEQDNKTVSPLLARQLSAGVIEDILLAVDEQLKPQLLRRNSSDTSVSDDDTSSPASPSATQRGLPAGALTNCVNDYRNQNLGHKSAPAFIELAGYADGAVNNDVGAVVAYALGGIGAWNTREGEKSLKVFLANAMTKAYERNTGQTNTAANNIKDKASFKSMAKRFLLSELGFIDDQGGPLHGFQDLQRYVNAIIDKAFSLADHTFDVRSDLGHNNALLKSKNIINHLLGLTFKASELGLDEDSANAAGKELTLREVLMDPRARANSGQLQQRIFASLHARHNDKKVKPKNYTTAIAAPTRDEDKGLLLFHDFHTHRNAPWSNRAPASAEDLAPVRFCKKMR